MSGPMRDPVSEEVDNVPDNDIEIVLQSPRVHTQIHVLYTKEKERKREGVAGSLGVKKAACS